MKEMLSVLRTSGIFFGISEEETEKMLHCLEVRPETYQKDEYILRAGDRVEAFGVVICYLNWPRKICALMKKLLTLDSEAAGQRFYHTFRQKHNAMAVRNLTSHFHASSWQIICLWTGAAFPWN